MPGQTSLSLLIIDRDVSVGQQFHEHLSASGFSIIEAVDARSGLDRFHESHPALLLVGLSLPDVESMEVITAVAGESSETPVIVITSPERIKEALAAVRNGAWDYLVTPINDARVLLHKINQALDRSRLLRENREYRQRLESLTNQHNSELPGTNHRIEMSKDRFKRLEDNALDMVYRMSLPDGRYEYVSSACHSLLGYTTEEFYQTPKMIERIIHPECQADFRRQWERLIDGDVLPGHDYRVVTSSGEDKWIYQRNTPVHGDNGKVVAIEGIITDVTRYKQTEAALRNNKKLLRGLMDNSPSVIYLKDRAGRYLLVNKRFEEFCRMSSEQILGKTDHELFTSEIADKFRDNDGKVLGAGAMLVMDEQAPHEEGLHVYFTTKFPLRDDDGEIYGVAGISTDVTGQKEAEAALRQSEEKFRMLSDQSLMGIHIVGGGVFRYVNEATARICGYSIDELMSWGPNEFTKLIHPDDLPYVMEQYHKKLSGATDYAVNYEMRVLTKSGEIRWVETFSKPVTLGDELADFIMIIDITDRKLAEQAMRDSEERMELALRGADLGMWDWFVQEDRIVINERWAEMLGYSLQEIQPTVATWEKLIHPDDLCSARKAVEDHLAGHTPHYEAEYRMLTKTGEWKWILDRGKVVERGDSGQPIRATGTHLDIDDRKRAEQALRERETTLRSIFLAAPMGIGLTRRRVMEWANKQMSQLIGYTEEEYTGKSARMLYQSEQEFHRVGREISAGIAEQGVGFADTRLVRKDGSFFDANIYVSPLDPSAPQSDTIVIISDVTEKKRDAAEKEKLEAQLRHSQKMEAVGQLAGGVAHDFNNILTAILGNAELALTSLSSKYPSEDPLLQGLRQIERSAERAAGLTRQLLAFSRRQISQPATFDLNYTLTEMEKMLQRLLVEDIELSIHLSTGPTYVHADPGQIEQVVMNLVVNARDAMPDGGTITMETRLVTLDETYTATRADIVPGQYVSLVVSDDGIGMSREVCERIFEPFFTTKAVGQGTGLGLATVYGIITQSEGHLEVYSEPDQGTSFKVYLPLAETGTPAARGGYDTELLPTGNETILVTEDDESVRVLAAQLLSNAGYKVILARNGKQALELEAQCVDDISLLVTDVIMPGMNGKKLSDALTARRPKLKTLFISGYTSNVIAHHGVLDPDVEFLEKPFNRYSFLKRVREVLDKVNSAVDKH